MAAKTAVAMEIRETGFDGLVELVPQIFQDERGFFLETFRQELLGNAGFQADFVQDNQSYSNKNVIRGLHLQLPPYEQIKMVRVATGKVLDVVVDIRKGSQTFGRSYSCVLDSKRCNSLYIPAGFAHGFAVLFLTGAIRLIVGPFFRAAGSFLGSGGVAFVRLFGSALAGLLRFLTRSVLRDFFLGGFLLAGCAGFFLWRF